MQDNNNDVEGDILCIIEKAACQRVHPGMLLRDDLGIDSMALVEIIVTAEEKFGIQLAGSQLAERPIDRVRDVIELMRNAVLEG